MSKKRKLGKRIVKIILIFLLCIFVLPFIAFGIIYFFVLPPQKLTPIVVNIVNENINAKFDCEEIQLTFFSTYPNIGIQLKDGSVQTSVAKDTLQDVFEYKGKDTLLNFSDCKVMFKVMDYVRDKKITIEDVKLDNVNIYGFINNEGQANWNIFKTDTIPDTDTVKTVLPPINVEKLNITNTRVALYNKSQQLYTSISGLSLSVKGELADSIRLLDIDASWERFRYYSKEYSLQNTLDLQLKTKLQLDDNFNHFVFTGAELYVNKMPFLINGELFNNSETGCLDMDVTYELTIPDTKNLLTFIPKKYIEGHNLKTTGEIALAGTLKGVLGNGSYPVINSICKIKGASLASDKIDYGIENMELDMDMNIDFAHNDSTYINLNKAYVKSEYFLVDIETKLTNLLKDPLFNGKIKSDINFTELSKAILEPDTLSMQGNFFADVNARFTLDDILTANYGKIHAIGNVDIKDFKAYSKPYEFDVTITNAQMTMTSERKIDNFTEGNVLNAKLLIDSFNVVYANNINTNFRNFYLSLNTPVALDTTGIIPVAGRVSFGRLKTLLPDSTLLWASKSEIRGGIFPSPQNKKSAILKAEIESDSLVYLISEMKTGAMLVKSNFDIRVNPYVARTRPRNINVDTTVFRQRDTANRDAVRRTYERDSTLILTGTSSELLSKWDVTGKLKFDKMRLWSVYFPIRIEMLGSTMQFNTNEVLLSNAKLTLGKSDFLLNGSIANIRRALLRGGRLSAELNTYSNYINCNELMDAIAKGINYGESFQLSDNVESLADLQSSVEQQSEAETEGLFQLPSFLNLSVHTKAKQIDYSHLQMNNTDGQILLRNQTVQLTSFYSKSNIGQGDMSMFYDARNKNEASIGVDIDLKNIQVEKFIDLIPSIDTLVPMLKSFEGVLDCQMVAAFKIDSTSSIVLPSLEAACYLQGEKMVLLDGETFTEISKKLMFKNKKRNLIDSIAVDLTIKNSNIEVYPFLVELDRYRLAVGGTHNLDMTFNYHISVLKSPVPFKLGVDITGSIDDFKFKVTSCKYKDVYKAVKTGTIDTARLNIKRTIYNSIQDYIKSNLIHYQPRYGLVPIFPEGNEGDTIKPVPLAYLEPKKSDSIN